MAAFSSLHYELDGVPKILDSLHDVARAVDSGRITADTPVTVYLTDSSMSRRPAAEHASLSALFAAPVGEEAAEVASAPPEPATPEPESLAPVAPEPLAPESTASEPVPPPAPVSSTPKASASAMPGLSSMAQSGLAMPSTVIATDAAKARAAAPAKASPPAPPPPPPTAMSNEASGAAPAAPTVAKSGTPRWLIPLLIAVIAALLLAVVVVLTGGDKGATEEGDGTETGQPTDTPPPEPEVAAEPDALTYFLSVEAPVRGRPTGKASKLGDLARGAQVVGVEVPAESDANYSWLRLTEGAFKGGYVYVPNLVRNAPPPLDSSTAGEYFVATPLTLYATPNVSGPVTDKQPSTLPFGKTLLVTGTVNGMAEIKHDRGGVAYAEWVYLSYHPDTDAGGTDYGYESDEGGYDPGLGQEPAYPAGLDDEDLDANKPARPTAQRPAPRVVDDVIVRGTPKGESGQRSGMTPVSGRVITDTADMPATRTRVGEDRGNRQ